MYNLPLMRNVCAGPGASRAPPLPVDSVSERVPTPQPCGAAHDPELGSSVGSMAPNTCGHCRRNLANTVTVEQHCIGPTGGAGMTVRCCNLCLDKVPLPAGTTVQQTLHLRPAGDTDVLACVVAPTEPDTLAEELGVAGAVYLSFAQRCNAGSDLNGGRHLVTVQTAKDNSGAYPKPTDWMPSFAVQRLNPAEPDPRPPTKLLGLTYTRPPPQQQRKAATRVSKAAATGLAHTAFLQELHDVYGAIAVAAQKVLERDTDNGKLAFLLAMMARARGTPGRIYDLQKLRLFFMAGEYILALAGSEMQTFHKDELGQRMIQARCVGR